MFKKWGLCFCYAFQWSSKNNPGFTLIELMMVAAIVGLLASIAIPKFANLIIKAKEASIKGKLGSLRGAFTIYYADTEGYTPIMGGYLAMSLIANGKYLDAMPSISIPTEPHHEEGDIMHTGLVDWWRSSVGKTHPWSFYPSSGTISVNCTHPDSSGVVWSSW